MTQSTGVEVNCRGLVYIYRLEGYDVVALAGVDLDIASGESVALVGPSGSGKSTLLAVIAGLLQPSAGRLVVGGYDVAKASTAELAAMRADSVGVVLQGAWRNLLPYLSAEQNVRFAQRGAGRRRRDLPSPREVLTLVGLAGRSRLRLRPHQLTPGERQRLALAVALSHRPGLLLADEPTSQLDSRARDEVVAALDSVRAAGTTVVLVTHDPEVGSRMGRTVTIRDGRVGAEGRRGEDFAVVGRDGSIHLPPEILDVFAPGTLVDVVLEPDGTARLVPIGARAGAGYPTGDGYPGRDGYAARDGYGAGYRGAPASAITAGPYAAGPYPAGAAQPGPMHGGPAGPVQVGPVQVGPVQAGPVQAGPVQAGPVQAGPVQGGPVQGGPAAAPVGPAGADEASAGNARSSGFSLSGQDIIDFDYWGDGGDQ
jgi:ABC-type lipoprotein export system ATPase subunit